MVEHIRCHKETQLAEAGSEAQPEYKEERDPQLVENMEIQSAVNMEIQPGEEWVLMVGHELHKAVFQNNQARAADVHLDQTQHCACLGRLHVQERKPWLEKTQA